MSKLRWGILGTGNIARQFAEGVRASELSVITAVASRRLEAACLFGAKYDIDACHEGYDALLARDDVDAVYLSLPNSMHHAWTIKALDAGKHVLCEKPLAVTEREALEMFAAAKRNQKTLVEAFMYRSHPQTDKLVSLVKEGVVGPVKLIRSSFCFRVRNWQGNIRFDPSLAGGALMDVGCYCLSLSRLIAGTAPTLVQAVARIHESGVDEQTSVVLQFGKGADAITAEFTCGMMVQADNTAYICGEEGYLSLGWPWKPTPPGSQIELRGSIPPRQDAPAGTKPAAPGPVVIEVPNTKALYAIEADEFVRVVRGERAAFVSDVESIENTRTLEQIRKQLGLGF
jgi:predicted dehydrogenase